MSDKTQQFMYTSGEADPVWIHTEPYSNFPQFPKLTSDLEADVCIIGSGIAGCSIAYELIKQNQSVIMIEARNMLSGETGRTSGHLSSAVDDGLTEIEKTFGKDKARLVAQAHDWALRHIGEVSRELGIDCEYRLLPGYDISQFEKGTKEHDEDVTQMKEEAKLGNELGLKAQYIEGFKVQGWDGMIDQRDAVVWQDQATFHPTKYVNGILKWLKKQPKFQGFSQTRAMNVQETGSNLPLVGSLVGGKGAQVETLDGNKITCQHAVEATCVPLQKLSVVAEMEFMRTYCIAVQIPRGSVEDCMIYDQAEMYKYLRVTRCDDKNDYLVVGGCDHKVGQEDDGEGRYRELETWIRERFTKAGSVDYKWSGQIFDPVDFVAFIGKNSGQDRIYIVTGDSGDGLTHGTIAGKLVSDLILEKENPWTEVYDPKRKASLVKKLPQIIMHDVQINTQYKRFLQSDVDDVEDIGRGKGAVLNPKTSAPLAIYRDEKGEVYKFSALCPHMKGVVCWNDAEKSWDCPVHGSRFSKYGIQVMGPAKAGLPPHDEKAEKIQIEG